MLDAIKRDAPQYLTAVGKFAAKKKLPNGSIVRVSITNPPLKGKKGGQS